MDEYN